MRIENVVYTITNKINGNQYIGSTTNYGKRVSRHITDLKKNSHHSIILQNAWNKHGKENFVFEIIEYVGSREELIPREQFFLDTHLPKYNIAIKAGNPTKGFCTEETRRKLSEAGKGRKYTEESIQKMRDSQKGRKVSEECRQKLREANLGKKHSEETKRKMSLSRTGRISCWKGKKFSEEHIQKIVASRKANKLRKMSEAAEKD